MVLQVRSSEETRTMSSRYKVYNKETATELMRKFSDVAYNISILPQVESAIQILYGKEFRVITDMAKRMQFQCRLCNQEMNSQGAVADHSRSGKHQKNLDKARIDSPGPSTIGSNNIIISSKLSKYSSGSIQYKLLRNGRAVGLQFLEEFGKGHKTYYRCFLCGAHGKIDAMYNHMSGNRHVEKYIKTTFALKYPVLTANERDGLRKKVIDLEGINVENIAVFRDPALYPRKWEAEGAAARSRQGRSIKEEIKSEPSSASSSDLEPEEPCRPETRAVAVQTTHTVKNEVTWSDLNDLCHLFYFMIAVDGPESYIKSVEDLDFVVELQMIVTSLLHKVNKSQKHDKPADLYESQKSHLEKILGSIVHVFRPAVVLTKESSQASAP